jgi:hypothetical protein
VSFVQLSAVTRVAVALVLSALIWVVIWGLL